MLFPSPQRARYVTAWINYGDALEATKDLKGALAAYDEALTYAPENQVAQNRAKTLRGKLGRLQGL